MLQLKQAYWNLVDGEYVRATRLIDVPEPEPPDADLLKKARAALARTRVPITPENINLFLACDYYSVNGNDVGWWKDADDTLDENGYAIKPTIE